MALAGLVSSLVLACGGSGGAEPSHQSVPPATIVSVASPQLDSPRIELETSLSTVYYSVAGVTTEEIFASIQANGPTDNLGRQGSGLTSVDWEYKWSGDMAPSGACSIRTLTVRADITVELPQHSDLNSLPQTTQVNWQNYAEGVAAHEQRHVDIYRAGAEAIQGAMDDVGIEATCARLESRIDQIWNDEQARINALQETFHNEESARLAAARGPLEAQIEANRATLSTLRGQIYNFDQQIDHLRAEISVFDNEVASIDAQIKQINDQFPNDLPQVIRKRLEELIEQSNKLLEVYNAKVDEHNTAIVVRNALSDEYDAILTQTNKMVDEFNWTR